MSNEDGDWKPSGRPQSTMARNFSASLNDAFAMDTNLDQLAQSVEQKKQALSSQNAELEAIQAKLRETEQRLMEKSRTSSPAGRAGAGTNSPHRRQPVGNAFNGQDNVRSQANSVTNPSNVHTPVPGVTASTMSQWRPTAQGPPLGGKSGTRDVPSEQDSGQQAGRYSQ